MMMRRWMMIVFGAAGLIVAPACLSFADGGHGGMKRGQMQGQQEEQCGRYLTHLLKHAKEFGLTSEQIGKVKAVQLDCKRTEARMEAEITIAQLELQALLEEEQADLSLIRTKVDQLKKAEGELLLAAIKGKREAVALLTPEQREKDRTHREKMKSAGEGQHDGGMGGMGRSGMGGGGHGGGMGDQGGGKQGGEQQHQH